MSSDTIIAPASALGGGIAVLRMSGPDALSSFTALTGIENPTPRHAYLSELKTRDGKMLDQGIAVFFEGPNSFTGENVAEFHIHGGRAVMQKMLQALLQLNPAAIRLAEGGEFTKRAYLNGKLDLTEAEAIADLVAAETEAQADQALMQMQGSLKTLYEGWRGRLLPLLAHMEAAIDFVDEEDVPDDLLRDINAKITALIGEIDAHLNDNGLGERLRDGFTVAVIGAPNAGKSSLVNALAKRDVAIVSAEAGTTRDAIEVHLNLGGYPVVLVDTAGLRDTDNTIEQIGIARAKKRAEHADIVLALFDGTCEKDRETLSQIDDRAIAIRTKSDVASQQNAADFGADLAVSAATQHNLDALVTALTEKIASLTGKKVNGTPLLTRARHREAVTETKTHLLRAKENPQPELKTEDMRMAARALGKLTGRVDVEDLLDVIFRDFCIGK